MNFRCFNFQKHSQRRHQGRPHFNFCALGRGRGRPQKNIFLVAITNFEIFCDHFSILNQFSVVFLNLKLCYYQSEFLFIADRTCFATCIDRGGLLDFALLSIVSYDFKKKRKLVHLYFRTCSTLVQVEHAMLLLNRY